MPMYQIKTAGIANSKGLGLFATRLIPRGTRILSEKPLLSLRRDQTPIAILGNVEQLGREERRALMELSGFKGKGLARWGRWVAILLWRVRHLKGSRNGSGKTMANSKAKSDQEWEWKWLRAWSRSWSWHWPDIKILKLKLREDKTLLDIWRSNSFHISSSISPSTSSAIPSPSPSSSSPITHALFPTIARLNHSCISNAQANWHPTLSAFNVHALRDISAGEEICLSYLEERGEPRAKRREILREGYGFLCGCVACDWEGDCGVGLGMGTGLGQGGDGGKEGEGGKDVGSQDVHMHGSSKNKTGNWERARAREWERQRLDMQTRLAAHQVSTKSSGPGNSNPTFNYASDGSMDSISSEFAQAFEQPGQDGHSASRASSSSSSNDNAESDADAAEIELTRAFASMLHTQGVRGREVASMLYQAATATAKGSADLDRVGLEIERDCLGDDHVDFRASRRRVRASEREAERRGRG